MIQVPSAICGPNGSFVVSARSPLMRAARSVTAMPEAAAMRMTPGSSVQATQAPAAAASQQLLKETVEDVLSTLTPRERQVLQLRFGLEDDRDRTLEAVGREFGVTRERIRQIEAKALRKLRHPSRLQRLRGYLEE